MRTNITKKKKKNLSSYVVYTVYKLSMSFWTFQNESEMISIRFCSTARSRSNVFNRIAAIKRNGLFLPVKLTLLLKTYTFLHSLCIVCVWTVRKKFLFTYHGHGKRKNTEKYFLNLKERKVWKNKIQVILYFKKYIVYTYYKYPF